MDRPVQHDLFRKPVRLLQIEEVAQAFNDELGIGRSTFFADYRDHVPTICTRLRKLGPGRYKRAGIRVREDVVEGIVDVIRHGYWPDYVAGLLRDEHPELYPVENEVERPASQDAVPGRNTA